MPLEATCSNEEKIPVQYTVSTATGRPASFDGDPQVSVVSGDGTFLATKTGPNTFSVDFVSGDAPGDTSFVVAVDADLGAGVVLVQDSFVLHVTGALAASLGGVVGAPIPK